MAIFRFAVESISRRTGSSAPAAAAYRAGKLIYNERTGRKHDFRRRSGVEDEFLLFPLGCTWAPDRSELWNIAEAREIRKDAKLARDLVGSIPWELNQAQRRALCDRFGHRLADYLGVAVDVCIHAPSRHGDDRNFHAHFLITTRVVGAAGLEAKTRQLDVSSSASIEVEYLRLMWEESVNDALDQAGSTERVSRLSHARRGDGLLPQITLGVAASAMERRGQPTEIGRRNREIGAYNANLIAHQREVAGFRAAVRRSARRPGAGQITESSGVTCERQPSRPISQVGQVSEPEVVADRTIPSFVERRSGSNRRMSAARSALGIEARPPLPTLTSATRTMISQRIPKRLDRSALVGNLEEAWGGSFPAQLCMRKDDILGDVMTLRIALHKQGVHSVPAAEGKYLTQSVPLESLVGIAGQLQHAQLGDFLKLIEDGGQASREAFNLKVQAEEEAERLAETERQKTKLAKQRADAAVARDLAVSILLKRVAAKDERVTEELRKLTPNSVAGPRAVDGLINSRPPGMTVAPQPAGLAPNKAEEPRKELGTEAAGPNPERLVDLAPEGQAILRGLAARGALFIGWAAHWARATSAGEGEVRAAALAAWQKEFETDAVKQAVQEIRAWGRANGEEVRKWAGGVEPVPAATVQIAAEHKAARLKEFELMRKAAQAKKSDDKGR